MDRSTGAAGTAGRWLLSFPAGSAGRALLVKWHVGRISSEAKLLSIGRTSLAEEAAQLSVLMWEYAWQAQETSSALVWTEENARGERADGDGMRWQVSRGTNLAFTLKWGPPLRWSRRQRSSQEEEFTELRKKPEVFTIPVLTVPSVFLF